MRLSPRENFGKTQIEQQLAARCDSLPRTHQQISVLKCQRKFYMAEVVLARICAGARATPGSDEKYTDLPKSFMGTEKGHGTNGICHGVRRTLYSFSLQAGHLAGVSYCK
jgi:hypothetical protein